MNPFQCAKEGNAEFFKAAELDRIMGSRDYYGNSVLHVAAEEGHLNCCEVIHGRCPQLLYTSNKHKFTPLHVAAQKNRAEIIKFLLYAVAKAEDIEMGRMGGVNVTAVSKLLTLVDEIKRTALHHAAEGGYVEVAKILIGADPSNHLLLMVDRYKLTALHYAVERSSVELAKLLIDADPSNHLLLMVDKDKFTALHYAVRRGSVELAKILAKILIGADPSNHLLMMVDWHKRTALHDAVERSSVELAQILIEADPKNDLLMMKDDAGRTALGLASDVQMAKLLISKAGPRSGELLMGSMQKQWFVDIFSSDQITSNFWAKFNEKAMHMDKVPQGLLDIVTEKNKFNALANKIQNWAVCLECVSSKGQNMLHLAAKFEAEYFVKLILGKTDIDVKLLNMQDIQGNTPLHLATLAGSPAIALSLLYDKRVDKFIRNKNRKSALDAINFEFDKRRAGVYGLIERVDEKDLKDRSDFDLLVGALISTVSFTAGITVPGGYFDIGPNEGNAVLSKKLSFEAFVLSNTIALVLSLYAVFSHFCTRHLIKEESIMYQLKVATYCSLGAIFAMIVAFVSGSYAVLAVSKWLAIAVSIICCSFFGFASRALWRMLNEQQESRLSHRPT